MIKLVDDTIKIEGTNGQLLYEFACLFNSFITDHPEIVAATCVHFGNKVENSGFDPEITHCAIEFLSQIGDTFNE